jgi:hypothetical protein
MVAQSAKFTLPSFFLPKPPPVPPPRIVPMAQFQFYSKIREDFRNLKGLSHEIDFKNFDKNVQNLA